MYEWSSGYFMLEFQQCGLNSFRSNILIYINDATQMHALKL